MKNDYEAACMLCVYCNIPKYRIRLVSAILYPKVLVTVYLVKSGIGTHLKLPISNTHNLHVHICSIASMNCETSNKTSPTFLPGTQEDKKTFSTKIFPCECENFHQ